MSRFGRLALLAAPAVLIASCGGRAGDPTSEGAAAARAPVASTGPGPRPATNAQPAVGASVVGGVGVGGGHPGRASYAPWPAAGHDAAHTGASTASGPSTGHIRWRRKLEGAVVPGPIVGPGGIAYVASNGGVLHAVDVSTGKDRWTFDGHGAYGSDLSTSPLLTPGGQVLWPGPGSKLFGLDAKTGAQAWSIDLGAQGHSPELAPDGSVIVGDGSGVVRALRLRGANPPTTAWMLDTGGSSYATPAIAPDGTVYTTVDSDLVALRSGREAWRVSARGQSEVSPAVAPDGTVILGSNDRVLRAFTPAGKPRWTYPLGDLTYASPAATRDGLIYIGDHFGRVTALSATTGERRLAVLGAGRTPGHSDVGVWTQPIVDAHHRVYFGTHPGHVYGFDAAGKRLFDVDTGGSVESYPALAADGTLLIGSESGELFAIR